MDKFHISTFPEKCWRHKANILTSQCSMTWFTLIGFESIGGIHSLKVMGNLSVDFKDLFPFNYDFVHMKNIIVV